MNKKIFIRSLCVVLVICCTLGIIFVTQINNNTKTTDKTVSTNKNDDYTAFTGENGIKELNYQSSADMLLDMQLVCRKGDFEFYFDPCSLFFAVKSISTGEIFTSNPYNASKTTNNASALHSQIGLSYGNNIDKVTTTFWSYDDCVKLSQFKVFKNAQGVKVSYSIGKDAAASVLPEVLSEKTFNKILDSFSGLAATQTKYLYTEYKSGDDLPENFKNISFDGSVFILNQNLSASEKERLEKNFAESNFTLDDLKDEYANLNFDAVLASSPNFKVNVYYTLTEKGLSVKVPADEIQFDKDTYYLLDISLLRYFGSEGYSGDEGFLLLPDGSGAIVEFSKEASGVSQIKNELYGIDYGITLPDEPSTTQAWYLPVFGLSRGNAAVVGIVEDGSGLTTLSFDTAGGIGSYYTAYPILTYTKSEVVTTEAKVYSAYSTNNTLKIDKNSYKGNFTVNYSLLCGDNISYYDMALVCREYYFGDNNTYTQEAVDLNIETIGAINYPSTFLGIPYTATAEITSYSQNQEILNSLKENGVKNMNFFLSAWRKGGFDCGVPTSFDPESQLGSTKELKSFFTYCEEQSIDSYADLNFSFATADNWFDDFSATKDTVKLLTAKLGGKMIVRPDLNEYDRETFVYALSPEKYSSYLNQFISKSSTKDISSFVISDIGNSLNSDFRKNKSYNREKTLDTIVSTLENSSKNTTLSFRGANGYVLRFASSLTDIPTTDSSLKGVSYDIPFIQLVCYGNIPYSSYELNSESNVKVALLKCISSVSSPKFILGMQNMDKIKLSNYTQYNSISFKTREEDCVEAYKYINNAFKKVIGAKLVNHSTLTDGVTKLDYSNGISIYVNATQTDYTYENVTVPAMDYTISE